MAKKQHWKKAIRAEVAAALQTKTASQAPSAPAAGPARDQNKPHATAAASPLPVTSLGDVRRVIIVAAVLLVLLALTTITDQKNHWLDALANRVAAHLPASATASPPPASTAATTPAAAPSK